MKKKQLNVKKTDLNKLAEWAVLGLLLVYVGIFVYFNLTQYLNQVDSDMAAEALLAKEMWTTKSVIPSTWFTSTERRILSTSLLGALFYGITNNMAVSIGLSCSVFMGIIIAGYFYLVKQLPLSGLAKYTGLLLIFAFPANCILAEGESLPYFTYLFFLYAGYYAPMGAFMFFTMGYYFKQIRNMEWKKSFWIVGAVLAVTSFVLGCSGMRTVEMVLLPLLLADLVRLYKKTERFTRIPSRMEIIPTVTVIALLAVNMMGMLMPFSVEYVSKFVTPEEIVSGLIGTVLPSLLEILGIAGGSELKSTGGLMQLLIYVMLAAMVYSCVMIFREKEKWEEKKEILLFYLFSVLLTAFILSVTMIGASANYFHSAIFLVAFAVAFLIDWFQDNSVFLKYALISFIILFAVFNLKYTYANALKQDREKNRDYAEAAEWLLENGYEYGYAEFWDANKLTMFTDGQVTVAPVTDIVSITPYCWLTSSNNYPFTLPPQMKTAYIMRREKREPFEEAMDAHPGLVQSFKNDRFVIFTGDLNYAIIFPEEGEDE